MYKETGRYKIKSLLPEIESKDIIIYHNEYYSFSDEDKIKLDENTIYIWSSLISRYGLSDSDYYKITKNPRTNFRSVYGNNPISCIESDEKQYICIKHVEQGSFCEADFIGYGDTEEEAFASCRKLEKHLLKTNKAIEEKREKIKKEENTIKIENLLSRYEYEEEEWDTSSAYLDSIISLEGGCEIIIESLIANALHERGVAEVEHLWPMVKAFRIIKKKDSDIILFETGRSDRGNFTPYHENEPEYLFSALDTKSEKCILRTNINNIGELEFEPVNYVFTAMSTTALNWCEMKNKEAAICWYEEYLEKMNKISKWKKDIEKDPTIDIIPEISEDELYKKLELITSLSKFAPEIRMAAKERLEKLKHEKIKKTKAEMKEIEDMMLEMSRAKLKEKYPDKDF